MNEEHLIIGMPAGSLADPKRGGNLVELLKTSGFKTKGYETGGPTDFPTLTFIMGWDGRPQEFGSQLSIREIDVAIAGDDWIKERILEFHTEYGLNINLKKILSLKRGEVKIVGIVDGKNPAQSILEYLQNIPPNKKIISMVAEMPYLALDWLRNNLKVLGLLDSYPEYSVQKYRTPPKIDQGIVIYETWGKTESKIKNGGVDIGLEITQTGSAIRSYGLKIIDTVLESETGIWINPVIKENLHKYDLLRMFVLNLYGSLNAEDKVLILFNVHKGKMDIIEAFLKKYNLFGDEPTVNVGPEYAEYNIQIETSNTAIPIAKVRYELAKLGARSIDTVPLISSIPNLEVLNF